MSETKFNCVVTSQDMICITYHTWLGSVDMMIWSEWQIRRARVHSWFKLCIRKACWWLWEMSKICQGIVEEAYSWF